MPFSPEYVAIKVPKTVAQPRLKGTIFWELYIWELYCTISLLTSNSFHDLKTPIVIYGFIYDTEEGVERP